MFRAHKKRNLQPVEPSRLNSDVFGRFLSSNAKAIFTFLLGLFIGVICSGNQNPHGSMRKTSSSTSHGSIKRLSETPVRDTSHKDDYGQPITKQQFLEPFEVSTITGFSVATLKQGQRLKLHDHENMHEFFYILEGSATFQMDGDKEQAISAGTFLHFAPHESHGIVVPENNPEGDMKMLVVGVVTDK
jgi:quercetin dioxygenase-like cupin family protein